MSWEKFITYFLVIVCVIFMAIFSYISIPILVQWLFNPDSLIKNKENIVTASNTLVVALISIITILITRYQTNESIKQTYTIIENTKKFNTESLEKTNQMIKDNQKSLKLTNESLNQNEEIMYVQLRFHNVEKALYNLQNEIRNAWTTYNELLELKTKEHYFDPRGFIIAQYIIWTYDLELFEQIPLGLKNMFYRMSNNGFPEKHLEFEEYFNSVHTISKSDIEKYQTEFRSHYEFCRFIDEFNENCTSGRFINSFKELYDSDINAPSIINFLIQIDEEIRQRSVEDFIYEEKLLKINHRSMMRKINENELNK